jgi:HEAT repeat protein
VPLFAEVLGDIGGDGVVAPLTDALANPHAAGSALVGLGKLRHPATVGPLIEYLDRTGNPSAATVLGNTGDRRAVPALIAALRHPNPSTRFYAARALGKLGDERALPGLELLREHDHTLEPRKTWRGKSISDVASIAIQRIRAAATLAE